MTTRVIATAGHVDHGKSSLIEALTGTHPDRTEQERRRGLSIELGFAHTTLVSGAVASFVDVPGHARYLRSMIAGVGAVAGCLFVVAANEGWKPQSEEHLRILELMGVGAGVIALTKIDLADPELRELAALDIVDHVAGSFLEEAPVIEVATPARHGLERLRLALDDMIRRSPAMANLGRARLWIDREFSSRGSGTIVTGTLVGGVLDVDDEVVIAPAGIFGRVRSLQTHAESVASIAPGNRAALNLAGVAHRAARRGDVVVHPGRWHMTNKIDVSLTVLPDVPQAITRRGAYFAYIGTRELPVRLSLIGGSEIQPAAIGYTRMFLPCRLPILPGDRFVLRELGRNLTVGGGEVLDIDPVRPVSKARPDRSLDRLIDERGWVDVTDLEQLTGQTMEPQIGRWVAAPSALEDARARLWTAVEDAAGAGLALAELNDRDQAVVLALEGVVVRSGRARLAAVPDAYADHPLVAAALEGGFHPGIDADGDRAAVRELVRRGQLVERERLLFHPDTIAAAARIAAGLLDEHPDGFTVSAFCERAATSRKFGLALLAELDGRGLTRRHEQLRIAGRRLSDVTAEPAE